MKDFILDEEDIGIAVLALKTALKGPYWENYRNDLAWLLFRIQQHMEAQDETED